MAGLARIDKDWKDPAIGKDWKDWQARQTTPDTLQTPSRHLSDNLQTTTKTPATITDKDGKSETMPDSLAD